MHRRSSQIVLLAVLFAFSWCPILGAETKTLSAQPGLIELRIQSPPGADVSWESRQPYSLAFKNYESNNVCVFCQHSPARLVLISDIIDWDARKRTKTTWIVNVGNAPDPQPGPDPEPGPQPSKYGLDVAARDAVALVDRNARVLAPKLAENFSNASTICAAGGFATMRAALQEVQRSNREDFGPHRAAWEPWLMKVGKVMDETEKVQSIDTVQEYGVALGEIAKGLRDASR